LQLLVRGMNQKPIGVVLPPTYGRLHLLTASSQAPGRCSPLCNGGLHCGEAEDHTERWVWRALPSSDGDRRRAPLRPVSVADAIGNQHAWCSRRPTASAISATRTWMPTSTSRVLPPFSGRAPLRRIWQRRSIYPAGPVFSPFNARLHCGRMFVTSMKVCVGVLPLADGGLHCGWLQHMIGCYGQSRVSAHDRRSPLRYIVGDAGHDLRFPCSRCLVAGSIAAASTICTCRPLRTCAPLSSGGFYRRQIKHLPPDRLRRYQRLPPSTAGSIAAWPTRLLAGLPGSCSRLSPAGSIAARCGSRRT
jgi:hypothetical protein